MDNEKLNNEEELESVETEETVEEVTEIPAEEVAEEITEEATSEETENIEDAEESSLEEPVKQSSGKVCGIVGAAVALVVVVVACLWYFGVINPYEKGYVDVSGKNIAQAADESGYTLREYKKMNGLPFVMSKYTNENAASNSVKLKAIIERSGNSLDDFKKQYGWNDSITEDTTVGDALGATKLSVLLGADSADEETSKQILEQFKEYYEFDENVTLDTLYRDVRNKMDEKTRQTRIEKEEAEKKQEEDNKDNKSADDKKSETEKTEDNAK
jgi:hypothetical protein